MTCANRDRGLDATSLWRGSTDAKTAYHVPPPSVSLGCRYNQCPCRARCPQSGPWVVGNRRRAVGPSGYIHHCRWLTHGPRNTHILQRSNNNSLHQRVTIGRKWCLPFFHGWPLRRARLTEPTSCRPGPRSKFQRYGNDAFSLPMRARTALRMPIC